MAGMAALPLQQFIASLDEICLPKILQVCSGVYFQGSIYEISGNEVCFSTGDLIKVTGIELLSVCCEDISNNEKFELPINHTGLFKVVPEEMPYSTLEEMLSLRPVGLESSLPFTFLSRSKMVLGNLTVGAGRALTVLTIEQHEGEGAKVRCQLQGQQESSAEVCIPLSYRGEFYECEGEERFTLQEIMSSACLRSRKFRFVNTAKCERVLVFSPVYQVQAIMSLRKNVLKFPSSLEMDVVDVSEQCHNVNFLSPLSLTEILTQPDESFPAVVEILEGPESQTLFKSSWLPQLIKHKHLVLHKKGTSAMVLLSSLKSRKAQQYFLVSQQYGGRFRRRPREFKSVYELYVALTQAPGLKASVTRNCEEVEEEGLPALSVGEQLEIVRCGRTELPRQGNDGRKQSVEALLCQRIQEPDDDGDDDNEDEGAQVEQEEIFLPLYMPGHFVEVLSDNRKYRLKELGQEFSLPLDVKVVSRDAELVTDPLVGLPCLRIEGAMLEPTIQASFTDSPEYCFDIPTKWLSMSVFFTQSPLPWPHDQSPQCHLETVTEVTEAFYYEFHKSGNAESLPPPRPPKPNLSSSKSTKKSKKPSKPKNSKCQPEITDPTKQFSGLSLNNDKRPPVPPPPADFDDKPPRVAPRKQSAGEMATSKAVPNTYVQTDKSMTQMAQCKDKELVNDHDYELIDETLAAMVKSAQEHAMFY